MLLHLSAVTFDSVFNPPEVPLLCRFLFGVTLSERLLEGVEFAEFDIC